jgi:UDP-glucose 4-epimerase
MSARVVVTGGSGFIGSHIVERLVARGDEVTIADAVPSPPDIRPDVRDQIRYVACDIRDQGALATAITPGVDVVYHLAAVVGVDQYLSRPLDVIDTSFSGTRNALELAARAGARIVVASTSEIFGKNPAVPWPEDGDRVLGPTTADRWAYSSAKALAEHMTFAFGRQHGVHATVVRYFNVYGPRQRPAYVVSRSVHRLLNNLPPVIYDEGGQTRCFTFVGDAARGTILAADTPAAAGTVFNLGSTEETTIGAVVRLLTELTEAGGGAVGVRTEDVLGPAYQDLRRRVPDTTRARTVLGWKCETSLSEGLTSTIEWARANPWWLALPDTGAS